MLDFLDFSILVQVFRDLKFLFSFLAPYWWIIFPFLVYFAFLIFRDILLFSAQSKFKSELEWDIFEIKVPREIEKGPKAMEQFFAGLWALWNTPSTWKEKYIDGEVTLWFSFEIVGKGGKVHFYIRAPKKRRHAVESLLYAEYPDIEIGDAEDYVREMPSSYGRLKENGYDLFGMELVLKNPAPNPLTTYMIFEEKGGEERIIDPISAILELLSKLRPEERFWLQFVVRPVVGWQKEGDKVITEIKENLALKPKPGPGGTQTFSFSLMTPAEEEKLKQISRKISKPGFETVIRHLYIAPKDIFNKDLGKNIGTYFGQYSSNINFLLPNFGAMTKADWWKWPYFFSKRRTETRKRKILTKYRTRYIPEESFFGRLSDPVRADMNKKSSVSILNTEELATLYHPPTNVVLTGPTLDRLESKKVSPPSYVPYE